jgi:hypothetical protein
MANRLDTSQTFTFSAGEFISSVVKLGEKGVLEGIEMPASWTTSNVTFLASRSSDGTYHDIYDADGNLVTCVVQPNSYVVLNAVVTRGVQFLKMKSISNQAGAREVVAAITTST